MFVKEKVTEQNVKKIASDILHDKNIIEALHLHEEHLCQNLYRIVYYFISMIELLDRQSILSRTEFDTYNASVLHEIMSTKDFNAHVTRCKETEQENDFIVYAAEQCNPTIDDCWLMFPILNAIAVSDELYIAFMQYCKAYLT